MLKISKRIDYLAKQLEGSKVICDVGCDHGLFCINAIKNYDVKFAYLLDINEEPLNSARKNFLKYNLVDSAKFVLTNGLMGFDETFDCLIISGMGGKLIKSILQNDINKLRNIKKMILQPNSDYELLREFLYSNGFSITFEDMILDNNKFCYYLSAVNKFTPFSSKDIKFGPFLRKSNNDVYRSYWQKKINKLTEASDKVNDENVKNDLNKKIEEIRVQILNN